MVQTFFHWFEHSHVARTKPWLIVGKGPSYADIERHGPENYNLFTLNHVVRDRPVAVAHAIDLDVVKDCAAAIDANAGVLVMPWVPHQNFTAGSQTLGQVIPELPILAKLEREGRLLTYDSATAPEAMRRGDAPLVPVTYFSAEAALGLLALAGEKDIHTIGIDGGRAYAADFKDLDTLTRLSNGQPSFDVQFAKCALILYRTGARLHPLGIPTPVRVFVGSEPGQDLALAVTIDSLRRTASIAMEVVPLAEAGISIPQPGDPALKGSAFLQRYLIPELCGHAGRAIYLEAGMVAIQDLRKLWPMPDDDFELRAAAARPGSGRPPQNSLLMLNAERLRWDIADIVARLDAGTLPLSAVRDEVRVGNPPPEPVIPHVWNDVEHFEPTVSAIVTYADRPLQPWVSHANPFDEPWFRALFAAVDSGAIPPDLVARSIARGHARPSLGIQLAHRLASGRRLRAAELHADSRFIAPWQYAAGTPQPGAHLPSGLLWQLRRQYSKLRPRSRRR